MENKKEEIIQPLTDEELEVASGGGDDGFRPGDAWRRCSACGMLNKGSTCSHRGRPLK